MKIQRNTDGGEGGGPDKSGEDTTLKTGENNGGGDNSGGDQGGDEAAAAEAARLAAEAAAAAKEPEPITDEVLFSEIGKRGYNIKSKEDLDRLASINEDEYVKVAGSKHAHILKKGAAWNGELETLLKISKMDIEKMDNKSAIVEKMMIEEGMSQKLAEITFNKKYGSAFKASEDDDYNEEDKMLAEHALNKDAQGAKQYLSTWKATEEQNGTKAAEVDTTAAEKYKQDWVLPVSKAVEALQKVSVGLKYELPDKTQVDEPVNYTVTPETKKIVSDVLSSSPTDLTKKLINEMSKNEKGESSFEALVANFTEFMNRGAIYHEIAKSASSRGLANHIDKVRSGDLSKQKQDLGKNAAESDSKSTINAANEAFKKQNNL